jgi:hypothetical protein
LADKTDPPARACELVGRFFYHFGRVELQLDAAITKLFKLDPVYAPIITANIDFVRKLNIAETAARQDGVVALRDKGLAIGTQRALGRSYAGRSPNVPSKCSALLAAR